MAYRRVTIASARRVSFEPAVDPDSGAIKMFHTALAEGRSLIAQRNLFEDRAIALLKDNLDYQLMTSIPGIGPSPTSTQEPRCHRAR
jgi:hypothetical protein